MVCGVWSLDLVIRHEFIQRKDILKLPNWIGLEDIKLRMNHRFERSIASCFFSIIENQKLLEAVHIADIKRDSNYCSLDKIEQTKSHQKLQKEHLQDVIWRFS